MARDVAQASATGDVSTVVPGVLYSVLLTGGSDAATLVVRDGSGGSTLLTLKAAANTSVQWTAVRGAAISSAIHATFTGTGPVASFEFD